MSSISRFFIKTIEVCIVVVTTKDSTIAPLVHFCRLSFLWKHFFSITNRDLRLLNWSVFVHDMLLFLLAAIRIFAHAPWSHKCDHGVDFSSTIWYICATISNIHSLMLWVRWKRIPIYTISWCMSFGTICWYHSPCALSCRLVPATYSNIWHW